MTELKFRNANIEDLDGIVAIYNSTIASRTVTADTEPVTVESRSKWFYEHDTVKRPLWVVEDTANNMIGWVSFQSFYGRPAYDATAEISIYLESTQRGKGAGKQILSYCIRMAPVYGIRNLLGFIFSHNTASLKLFRSFGFEEWGVLPDVAVLDGQTKSLTIVGRKIKDEAF